MSSRTKWGYGHLLLLSLTSAIMISSSFAFQSTSKATLRSLTRTNMMDPKTAIDAVLSAMLVQPAGGLTFFGAPDPYIKAGKSIPPSAKALAEFGITPAKTAADYAGPNASPEYIQSIQEAMDKGWKITTIDKIRPTGQVTLPGFSETHGILPTHRYDLLPPTPVGFMEDISWASKYYAVFDHLPLAVFLYCVVEFLFLRPGIDFYKEEIEADPTGAAIDTFAVFGVRAVAIAIVSTLIVWIFGTSGVPSLPAQ